MHKKKLISLALIFLILSMVLTTGAAGNENFEESILMGVWYNSFPMADQVNLYSFFSDYRYIYFDPSEYNIVHRYGGSMGWWKIEKNKIYIYPLKNIYYEKDWVYYEDIGEYMPGDSNTMYLSDNEYPEWMMICNLETFKGEQTVDYLGTKMIIPINFEAKYLINGEISEDVYRYSKFYEKPQDDYYIEYFLKIFSREFDGLLEMK